MAKLSDKQVEEEWSTLNKRKSLARKRRQVAKLEKEALMAEIELEALPRHSMWDTTSGTKGYQLKD